MEIITLLKANIKHRKSSFISLLLLMMIVSTVLTSVVSTRENISKRADIANEQAKTGDIVVFIQDSSLSDKMIANVKSCDSVQDVEITKSIVLFEADVNGQKSYTPLYLTAYDSGKSPLGIYSDDYRSFAKNNPPLKDGEVYLPLSMKNAYSCTRGDKVCVQFKERTEAFTIAGFIEEPFMGADVIVMKKLLITQADFNRIYSENLTEQNGGILSDEYSAAIDLVNIFSTPEYSEKVNQMTREVNDATNIISFAASTLTKEQSVTYTLLLPRILCNVLLIFVFLLLIIVVLVLSNNIVTSIEMNYANLGILKSQGFTKGAIRLILLLQYLIPGMIGSIIGLFLSIPIVDFFRIVFIKSCGLLFPNRVMFAESSIILIFILTVLSAIIFLQTRKVSKISPVRAISGGIETIHFSSMLQAPVLGKSKAFLGFRLAFRQLTSNIRQYAGTCLILSLLVLYLSTCASFKKTFTEEYYNELYGVISSDVLVDYNDNMEIQDEIEKEISNFSSVKESFFYTNKFFLMEGVQYNAQILDNMDYLNSVLEGRAPKYDNEIVITNFVRERINRTIGDKILIKSGKNEFEFMITGIYDSCTGAGSCFAITLDGAEKLIPKFNADSRNYILENSDQKENVIKAINEKFADKYDIEAKTTTAMSDSTIRTVMNSTDSIISFVYLVSVIFTMIVIWMVCNKSFLKEKHDLGIYKAFGFTSFSIRLQFCIRYLLIAFVGSILGCILFIAFGDELNGTTLIALGISNYESELTVTNLLIPSIIIYLFVFVTAFVTLRKVKYVDPKELIVE